MSSRGEGKEETPPRLTFYLEAVVTSRLLYKCTVIQMKQTKLLHFVHNFLRRVRRPWRATWRAWRACWRPTFRTTKTKSCAFYAPCKSAAPLTVSLFRSIRVALLTESCFRDSARILPEKLSVYTTLVGLLNARNYNFGGEFVEAMIRQLKETLKNNLYNEAVYLVRPDLIFTQLN